MAKQSNKPKPYQKTKKHLAKQEREQRQRRVIIITSVVVGVLAIILVTIGVLQYAVIQPNQPIAIVNEEEIKTADWQRQTSFFRFNIITNIENSLQFAALLGDDPNSLSTIINQIQPLTNQLQPPEIAGQFTMDTMIDNVLIMQEANRRGISVTDEEIQNGFQAAFGYFPDGTPTPKSTTAPIATSTHSSIQQTLIPPNETPTQSPTIETEEIFPTPTQQENPTESPTPSASATPFTLDGYEKLVKETLNSFQEAYGISKKDFQESLHYSIEAQIYQEKLLKNMTTDVACSEHQVWARHILVDDEDASIDIRRRLDNGEDFCNLAEEFSTDLSNKDKCGDLGWFGEGSMVAEFENAAYQLEIGQVSEPVETQFGWHIIQSLGNEDRPLSDIACQQKKEGVFNEWLNVERMNSDIVIMEYWKDRVPDEPTLPLQTQLVIQQIIANSSLPNTPIQP